VGKWRNCGTELNTKTHRIGEIPSTEIADLSKVHAGKFMLHTLFVFCVTQKKNKILLT